MHKPSITMQAVCAARANNAELLNYDCALTQYVMQQLPEARQFQATLDACSQHMFTRSVIVRTRYFSDILATHATSCEQIVILSSGLDFRYLPFKDSHKIFLIDHPLSLRFMLELTANYQELPASVTTLALDFENTTITEFCDLLYAHGFSPTKPTVFLWEGATYYCKPHTVNTILSAIQLATPQCRLVADFANSESWCNPKSEHPDRKYEVTPPLDAGAKQALTQLNEQREPWQGFFSIIEIERLLQDFGFSAIEIKFDSELEMQYLKKSFMDTRSMFYVNATRK